MHKARLFFLVSTVIVAILTFWVFLIVWLDRVPLRASTVSASVTSQTDKLNINTATARQFAVLPGIGPNLSEAIITYRTEKGGFSSIGELAEVPGIGPGKLETIADLITVGG